MSIPTQVFNLREVTTKSVTLYPARAHVVREIPGIILQPGANEIEIKGLGPMVEEQSIQIEGRGQASITDISVSLVPNDEVYTDVYPESDLDDDDDDDDDLSDDESDALKALNKEIEDLEIDLAAANRKAEASTALADYNESIFGSGVDFKPADFAANMQVYEEHYDRLYKASVVAQKDIESINKRIKKKTLQKQKVFKAELKKQEDAKKAKRKEQEKKNRIRAEKLQQRARVREERYKYWPTSVYRAVLRLETTVNETPASSRRNSVETLTVAKDVSAKEDVTATVSDSKLEVSLLLSYVTDSAFWTPKYDVNINSVQKSAAITYRAELTNNTSEYWVDSKVIISTSQVSFSGLDDKAPTMNPWNIRLVKGSRDYGNTVLSSVDEMSKTRSRHSGANESKKKLLGYKESNSHGPPQPFQQQQQQQLQQLQQLQQHAPGAPPYASIFMSQVQPPATKSARKSASLFGIGRSRSRAAPQANRYLSAQQALSGVAIAHEDRSYDPTIEDSAFGGGGGERQNPSDSGSDDEEEDEANVDFEESSWENYGITATYELPGTRTLEPSSVNRRYKIATLNSPNIDLSHIAVPKLRPAAFMRAKIRNPSSAITLIKGSAGITLDGSFLGSLPLERVSPGQTFTIPLGVDPAIDIRYPKPTVHRSSQGIFSKESAQVFTRQIIITNTKPVPCSITLLDQVPVSTEERLAINIVHPRGLSKEKDLVKTGTALNEGSRAAWGNATAQLKKNGEVCFVANMEKGQASCVLKLEYAANFPATDSIGNA